MDDEDPSAVVSADDSERLDDGADAGASAGAGSVSIVNVIYSI
jgi:hypothetical protein